MAVHARMAAQGLAFDRPKSPNEVTNPASLLLGLCHNVAASPLQYLGLLLWPARRIQLQRSHSEALLISYSSLEEEEEINSIPLQYLGLLL